MEDMIKKDLERKHGMEKKKKPHTLEEYVADDEMLHLWLVKKLVGKMMKKKAER